MNGEATNDNREQESQAAPRKSYIIQMVPREEKLLTEETERFTGNFLIYRKEGKNFDAVDTAELVSQWNKVCPFRTPGERWLFFEDHLYNYNRFYQGPEIIVRRDSEIKYKILYQSRDYVMANRKLEVLKLSDHPVPIPDVQRGFWRTDFPCKGYPNHWAAMYVEYYGDKMRWVYNSIISVEEGRMGRYVDYDYSDVKEYSETEFSSREELMQKLMDFIPRHEDIWHRNPDAGEHGIYKDKLPDEKLEKLLDKFFR